MQFTVTWDYLCPFARNVHEAIVDGLRQGTSWDVTFQAFSLSQVHLSEGEPAAWDRPEPPSGLLALSWGVAVRDEFSEKFLDVHEAIFAARHDEGRDINDESVIRDVVSSVGLDADAVAAVVASGKPLARVGEEHTLGVERHRVFGVPTFIVDEEAVFVRLMSRHDVDAIERIVTQVAWTELNEFKRTRVPR